MQAENTKQGWGFVQIALHWLVVLAVVIQLILGFKFWQMAADDPQKGALMPYHAGIGLVILGLMLMRLYWRLTHPVPELPDTMTSTQKWLAHATHWAFYILLIGVPLGGYLLVSAAGHPIPFFNAQLPALIGKNETLRYALLGLHIAGALALVMLMALHISAALRHAWALRDGVMEKMVPFLKRR